MTARQDPFREMVSEITANLHQVLSENLEKQLSESWTKSLLESEFYRKVNEDMRSGLRKIYREVNVVQSAAEEEVLDKEQADRLFQDASDQLSAVLRQTEDAANMIMSLLEKQMEMQTESSNLLDLASKGRITPDGWKRLREINASLNDDLVALMTAMSFQDLTGQRIKKAVTAIKQLEATVLELYVSSGLMIKVYSEEPDQDMSDIVRKTKAQVADITKKVVDSELKGPKENANQGDIDALLAEFGL